MRAGTYALKMFFYNMPDIMRQRRNKREYRSAVKCDSERRGTRSYAVAVNARHDVPVVRHNRGFASDRSGSFSVPSHAAAPKPFVPLRV